MKKNQTKTQRYSVKTEKVGKIGNYDAIVKTYTPRKNGAVEVRILPAVRIGTDRKPKS